MIVDGARVVRGSLATVVGLTAMTIGITWLFLGMRAVMDVGGFCASGGPYEIATPCPQGVPGVILGGIFGGLIGLFLYLKAGLKAGPRVALLGWPALFLSLGWNFLWYGLNPAGHDGIEAGNLVVAAVFLLMGGAPLLFLFDRGHLRALLWADPPESAPALVTLTTGSRAPGNRAPGSLPPPDPRPDPRQPPAGSAGDLSEALERLHQLHQRGALTDDEYGAAKQRLLG